MVLLNILPSLPYF